MEKSNFRIECANFADDGTLCMVLLDYKCKMSNKIKYNYRSNMKNEKWVLMCFLTGQDSIN